MSKDENADIADRLQQKFDFYMIALTFGVLGLSIQTARFGRAVTADSLELMGWALLLSSGLVGLSRLEWLPQLYHAYSQRENLAVQVSGLRRAAQTSRVVVQAGPIDIAPTVDELISRGDSNVARIDADALKIHRQTLWKYRFQRLAFALGISTIVAARGLAPFARLFGFVLR
jgi:hypothetical protein